MSGEFAIHNEMIETEAALEARTGEAYTSDINIDTLDKSVLLEDVSQHVNETRDTAWSTSDIDVDALDKSVLLEDVSQDTDETRDTEWFTSDIDIDALDKSVLLEDGPQRTDKMCVLQPTELTDEMRDTLRDAGYSEEVIERIGSKEEAEIYLNAELECQQINGKDALVRTDIDLEQTDDFGRTNLERMEKGLAPLDADGKPYELHHIGQNADSPLAELTRGEHMGGGNNTILHDVKKESEINRGDFNKERAEHWKARAEEIKNQQNEVAA